MTSWIITIVLALLISRIVVIEIRCGRKSKAFMTQANAEIATLQRSAVMAYKQKFGREPTAPFALIDDTVDKVSSKRS